MKKLYAVLLICILLFSVAGCGEPASNPETNQNEEVIGNQTETVTGEKEDSDEAEWKKFLADYEAWVDDYIELAKKYKENPMDLSIMSDYTEMLGNLTDWANRADEVTNDLADDPKAAAEYAAELAKIAAKLAQATT